MPPRSKVKRLPPAVKAWLDKTLRDGSFSDYEQLEAELKARGYSIGKSSLHRYGQAMEITLAAVKASSEAAVLIKEAAPDDADHMSAAVISLLQTEIFNILMTLQKGETEDPEERLQLMSKAAKGIADLTRASLGQKKHEAGVKARVLAKVEEAATAQGLDEAQARFWRDKVLAAF
jgi:uncharacterized protein YcbK (DUF882 family)